MKRRGLLAAFAVAVAAALVIVLVAITTAPGPRVPTLPPSGIRAAATLTPRAALFGDTLLLSADVLVDSRRIDPSTLRLSGNFVPYDSTGAPSVVRRRIGHVTRSTLTLRLRCLIRPCLPPPPAAGGRRTFTLHTPEVLFRRRGAQGRESLPLTLPDVQIASRMSPQDEAFVGALQQAPFHAAAALGQVEYAVPPGLLVALALTGAVLLLALAGWLVLRYGRRPVEAAVEPPPAPPVVLTPLERARVSGSVPDQRKALDLIARELGRNGDAELATSAQGLAWSAQGPAATATLAFAADVRTVIERSSDGQA